MRRCVGHRTRVRGQAASVDGQSDIESALGVARQILSVDLTETSGEAILGDGGEGRSLDREIQDGLIFLRSPQVEDDSIEISTGHIDGSEASASKNGIVLVKNAITNLASSVSLSGAWNVPFLGLLETLLESGLNDAVCLLENDHGDGLMP